MSRPLWPEVPPPLPDLEAARRLLAGRLPPTPTQPSPALSRRLGRPAYLKLELFQPIRTFKVRGALCRVAALHAAGVRGTVVTASGGNHGLAVAYAAAQFGLAATVYVPDAVSEAKATAMADLGAEVVRAGADYQAAAEAAHERVRRTGEAYVHAFDDPEVIAGQGTVGLEILDQVGPADVYVGVGGGGLAGGIALAMAGTASRVFGVEMAGADSMARSLAAGRVVTLDQVRTAADGLAPRAPSERTLALMARHAAGVRILPEERLGLGVAFLLERERLWAEPSGAAAVSSLLLDGPAAGELPVVAVVSGGNATPAQIRAVWPELAGG
jgi:threonine dehydratase